MCNCGTCAFVLSNPTHPYVTHCEAQYELTGRGMRGPLPHYDCTLDYNLTAMVAQHSYWKHLDRKATLVISWADDGEPAMVEHSGYSFATALACVDPFQHRGIAYTPARIAHGDRDLP